jgi:antitoxin VapB
MGHMALAYTSDARKEAIAVPEERRVHLFRNGRNQALRIPREWELDADEALLRREDGVLTVVPVPRAGLLTWLAALEPLDVPFPEIGDDDLLPLDEPTW